jgi:protein-disulfide isomerase
MPASFERGVSLLLSLCAVTIAGSVVWREFAGLPADRPSNRASYPEFLSGWETALGIGIRVGPESARVKIVEFADLECPACRRFQNVIREVLQEYPQDVALFFVHLPLPGHRFAMPAARAVECAEREGRFIPMVEAVFAKQDSLGIKSWGSFAWDAGIRDSAAIAACARDDHPVARISAGAALAERLQVLATPTVLVNGWQFLGPTKQRLVNAIEAVRKGRAPNQSPGN